MRLSASSHPRLSSEKHFATSNTGSDCSCGNVSHASYLISDNSRVIPDPDAIHLRQAVGNATQKLNEMFLQEHYSFCSLKC
jgi:hypothetical protein